MATTWGSTEGHLRVGIDCWTTTPTASSTAVAVSLRVYVQCMDSWDFDDDQDFKVTGTGGGTGTFHNSLSGSSTKLIYSHDMSASIDYDGGPTYTWTASISDMYNGGTPSHTRSITLPKRPASPPSAPATPTAASITSTSAALSWSVPANNGAAIDSYGLWVSTSSTFPGSTYVTQTGTSRTWTGLAKGTTYYARVNAHNAAGWGSYSGTRTFTTGTTAPGSMTAPTVGSIGATTASVTWSAPSDDGGKDLDLIAGQVSRNSTFTDVILSWESAGTDIRKDLTGLPKGAVLYVRTQAHNAVGWGAWSPSRTFTTDTTAAGATSKPSVASVLATSASVSWSAPSDTGGASITGYELQRDTSSSFAAPVTATTTNPSTSLSGLLPGTTYYLRVRAVTSAGTGGWSATTTFTTLSGVKVGDGTRWVDAIVWVGDGSKWVLAQVKSGNGTTWK
ncbi:fibronectin type III domain-containing protein [Micromonospora sp. CB01531]|uniref:fibronectin type III domain-containing protein n=1 Tax=Micromonospora sp. CB01531 TaxID=1718947 RepID=UPI00093BFC53|nr:fibronectin type III domain-containing protein [Micromonospora sp. CB01531]OKI45116.1 hypothetical protein A6A27_11920 [Micromonospora sp. CB01531]